ncbi:hypothetical protein [Pseudomonas sp. LB3P25]
MNPATPDGRYFVVKGQLWRCTNPSLNEDERQRLVDELMAARREVAKVALGERGPVWWDDGSPDFNRYQVANTPYCDWYCSLSADTARPSESN